MGGYGKQLDRGEDAFFRRESGLRLMLCYGTGDLGLEPGEEDLVLVTRSCRSRVGVWLKLWAQRMGEPLNPPEGAFWDTGGLLMIVLTG